MNCFCTGHCRCRCAGYTCWRCGCWVGNWQVHHCCHRPVVIPAPYTRPRPQPWRVRDPHWRGDIICKASEVARNIK